MLALDIVLVLAIVIVLDIVRSYRALARGCACVRHRDRTQYHACTRVSLALVYRLLVLVLALMSFISCVAPPADYSLCMRAR